LREKGAISPNVRGLHRIGCVEAIPTEARYLLSLECAFVGRAEKPRRNKRGRHAEKGERHGELFLAWDGGRGPREQREEGKEIAEIAGRELSAGAADGNSYSFPKKKAFARESRTRNRSRREASLLLSGEKNFKAFPPIGGDRDRFRMH